MPKVHVQGNRVTLTDELRNALATAADDAIDAEEVDDGVFSNALLRREEAQAWPTCVPRNRGLSISAHR